MERKFKSLLVLTGIVMSAAVALTPLTSYAEETSTIGLPPCDPDWDSARIENENGVDLPTKPIAPTEPTDERDPEYQKLMSEYAEKLDAYNKELKEYEEAMEAYKAAGGFGKVLCAQSAAAGSRAAQTGNMEVNVNVATSIAIDVATGGPTIMAFPDTYTSGQFDVKVRSAMPFTVSLSAEEPDLMDAAKDIGIKARDTLNPGQSGWCIEKKGDAGLTEADGSWTIGCTKITETPKVFYDSGDENAEDGKWIFTDADSTTDKGQGLKIDVTVTDQIPQGLYQTEVTVTAAAKI